MLDYKNIDSVHRKGLLALPQGCSILLKIYLCADLVLKILIGSKKGPEPANHAPQDHL